VPFVTLCLASLFARAPGPLRAEIQSAATREALEALVDATGTNNALARIMPPGDARLVFTQSLARCSAYRDAWLATCSFRPAPAPAGGRPDPGSRLLHRPP